MKDKTQLIKYLADERATELLGGSFARALCALKPAIATEGLNIRLEGELGAGKTCLVRSILREMDFQGRVKSPTFTLLEPYEVQGLRINHFDFYRFECAEEFEDAGFRDAFGPGQLCLTEWSQKAEPFVPAADLLVRLEPKGEGRQVQIEPQTLAGERLLRVLEL